MARVGHLSDKWTSDKSDKNRTNAGHASFVGHASDIPHTDRLFRRTPIGHSGGGSDFRRTRIGQAGPTELGLSPGCHCAPARPWTALNEQLPAVLASAQTT